MKIQVTHLFEDTGFCKDVFQSVSEPRFYINRDSETGEWYTATPVYYENDSRVRTDVVIEILFDGEAVALDGNGTFDGKRPFVPFHQFRERVTKLLMDKYPALKGYPKLALYIVDTNWAVDGESGSYEVVFTLHQDALRQFHNDLLEERNSGSIEQWREHSEFAEEETAASYECWLDGCYCENHYKIEVKRRELPLAPGFLRMAANVYRTRRILRDFGQEAARQNEYQALTEAEKKQLLARSDIAEYVMRRLERRVAYWEAYRGAVSDTVRDILRERSAEVPRQCPMNGTEERHDEKSL